MKARDFMAAAVAAVMTASVLSLPSLGRMDGLGIDSLHWLRHTFSGSQYKAEKSPTVVLAIDEETFQRRPFKNLPKIMWSKQLAGILDSILAGQAKVIGFDLIFPTSVEGLLPNFERELRLSLFKAARKNQIVLGKVQHSAKPVSPHPGQSLIVRDEKNIRSVNAFEDIDGIIRRLPLTFKAENQDKSIRTESSIALELASRAEDKPWKVKGDGSILFGDWVIPGSHTGNITLNFPAGSNAVPTYSFADLSACAGAGKTAYFTKHFKDKVVLLGTVLDVEDRKLTSKRFITGEEGAKTTERCQLPVMTSLHQAGIVRDAIPGVYIHAAAINNLIRQDPLTELSRAENALIALVIALIAAGLTLSLAPAIAGAAVGGVLIGWTGTSIALFSSGLTASLYDPMIAAVLTFGLLLGYKFAVADKDKRYIRKVFSYYLPQTVIEQMTSDDKLPTLGGESKEVTILFSDIAKFSLLSEALSASELAAFLNEYLTEMSDIIEAGGGFIEKYVADEITAVFGAPIDDPDHALSAVSSALACRTRLNEMPGAFGLPAGATLTARTGINSGDMLVGNIGSYRRFTYAAMGDAANLGSRLEGANKYFGSMMMVGERTRELCGDRAIFRKIDKILVVNRETPVQVFEPLGLPGDVDDNALRLKQTYEAALEVYRARNFERAAGLFGALSSEDPVSAVFETRCREYQAAPPPDDWDGSFVLAGK